MLDLILDILQTPALILSLVALIGLSLQKKSPGKIFSGTVKTALGMLVLAAGSGLLVAEILPFVDLFALVFNLEGFATSSEAVVAAMQSTVPEIASASAIIMGLGFLVNIAVARFTPLKYIFLTGHMMWILSVAIAGSLYAAGYSYTSNLIIGSILQGMLMALLPAIGQPMVRKVTGNDYYAIAHLTTLGTAFSGWVGGLLGDKSKDAEDINVPKSLEFFKDTSMSIVIIMGIFYLMVVLLAGPDAVAEHAGDTNYILFGLLKSLGFTAGVLILLQGVRMFLGELVPAFKGISDRLVPGAIPALDVPVLFAAAPNSLMIGFITSTIGMIVGMVASSIAFGVVPLISIIGAFFTGGVSGIYGNATGGRRGSIIAGLIYGFMLIFGSGFLFTMIDYSAYGAAGVGHDTVDVMAVMTILTNPIIGFVIIGAVFILVSYLEYKRIKKQQLVETE